jgi:hypothetical protein
MYTDINKTCNILVTLRRVPATIVAVERQWLLHILSVCICSPRYPAYNALAPYFHLWPALLDIIFRHYLINSTVFEKKMLLSTKCAFFLYNFCQTFLILRRNEPDMIKMYSGVDKSLARPGRIQAIATEDFDVHISYL